MAVISLGQRRRSPLAGVGEAAEIFGTRTKEARGRKREEEAEEELQRKVQEEDVNLEELLPLARQAGLSAGETSVLTQSVERRQREKRTNTALDQFALDIQEARTSEERFTAATNVARVNPSLGITIMQQLGSLSKKTETRDVELFDEEGQSQKIAVPKNLPEGQLEKLFPEGFTRVKPIGSGVTTDVQKDVNALAKSFKGTPQEKRDKARLAKRSEANFAREIDKRTKNINEQGFTISRSTTEDVVNQLAKQKFIETIDAENIDVGDQVAFAVREGEARMNKALSTITSLRTKGKSDAEIATAIGEFLGISNLEAANLIDAFDGNDPLLTESQ